jgi:hypothetical protein
LGKARWTSDEMLSLALVNWLLAVIVWMLKEPAKT